MEAVDGVTVHDRDATISRYPC